MLYIWHSIHIKPNKRKHVMKSSNLKRIAEVNKKEWTDMLNDNPMKYGEYRKLCCEIHKRNYLRYPTKEEIEEVFGEDK